MTDTPTHDDRQSRRDRIAVLLRRILGGKALSPDEGRSLSAYVSAEQREADQTRAQRDEARELAIDARSEYEVVRHDLAAALGLGTDARWDYITNYARQLVKALAAERAANDLHRHNLADELDLPTAASWPNISLRIRTLRRDLADAENRADGRAEAVEKWKTHAVQRRQRAEAAEAAVADLAQAIRLTREYVGADTLPAVDGWAWYDALRRHAPQALALAELGDDQPTAPSLAALTTPVTPREHQFVGPGHVVHELIDALTDDSALTEPAARNLIGRYYAAITSAPPAKPHCTCAGVGFGTGDCPMHHPPQPDESAVMYPRPDGEFTILGPDTFTNANRTVIHHQGQNYYRSEPSDAAERCCVCGSPEVAYHNFNDRPFCWPCADGQQTVIPTETARALHTALSNALGEHD